MAVLDELCSKNKVRAILCYDILEQILPLLPVKTLLRFKSVSKQLRDFFSDPRFVKLHVHHANYNYNIGRIHMSGSTRFYRGPLEDDSSSCQINYEPDKNPWTVALSSIYSDSSEIQTDEMHNPFDVPIDKIHILGSCNGLLFILIANETFLWNPSIREFIKLPPLKKFWDEFWGLHLHLFLIAGLGYDSLNDEYKAVLYFDFRNKLFIYNSRVGCWKETNHDFPEFALRGRHWPGIVVNGCPHWVVENYMEAHYVPNRSNQIIIFFDTLDEKFKRVPIPNGWKDYYECGLLARCLCVTPRNRVHRTIDVWVMNEFGKTDSWTKLFEVTLSVVYKWFRPLGFTNNGDEVVVEVQSKTITTYNHKTEKENFVIRSTCFAITGFNSFQYVNSLVSPYRFAIETRKTEKQEEKMRKK